MDGICNPQNVAEVQENMLAIDPERYAAIADAVGSWSFSAHDFSEDELIHAASLMLQHALNMPDLEQWRLSADKLNIFLTASRTAYNSFVPYHNFRHVIDVLQAVFYFLLQLGTIPPYSPDPSLPAPAPREVSPVAALLQPLDALTLLITAIGHDVGHPGVNNAFLVSLNAPLAQLYNDRSVLEAFHCAAYSQILRRHWPAAFNAPEIRKLLINSILATDMGLHFDYMKKMGWLHERLDHDGGTDGWDGRFKEEQRTTTCSLLIKCADISNVARRFGIAKQWALILTDEWARQASMEDELGIPTTLNGLPVKDNVMEMGKSQTGFMNLFALPLFQGVTEILPAMQFTVDEMNSNIRIWEGKMGEEKKLKRESVESAKNKENRGPTSAATENGSAGLSPLSLCDSADGALSPRSGSIQTLAPPTYPEKKNLNAAFQQQQQQQQQQQKQKQPAPPLPIVLAEHNTNENESREGNEESNRSSFASIERNHLIQDKDLRRLSAGPPPSPLPDTASRRSSGALPTSFMAHHGSSDSGHSSDTITHALNSNRRLTNGGDVGGTDGTMESSSAESTSTEQPLVAVVFASPRRASTSNDACTATTTNTTSTSTSTTTTTKQAVRSRSYVSVPSLADRTSQATSGATNTIPYSPSTKATSILSATGSDRSDAGGGRPASSPLATSSSPLATSSSHEQGRSGGTGLEGGDKALNKQQQQPEKGQITTTVLLDSSTAMRHRPSRWKLSFWKTKRRVTESMS
ncbi:MAG: 3',5'-cyclic-nucleotide phosphodiesterase [Trizodia sp. TS-e1964]|nr:MAG: 3',5'-cyclic-nucleotide phosphodiesterase [Trizodia sp. TS-e1964]